MPELQDNYNAMEDWEKVEFLMELEFEEQEEKWDLINQIIPDTADYDLARVQALKILEVADIPQDKKAMLAETLEKVIKEDEDYDVRNYATVAMKNFMDYPAIEALAKKIVLDTAEDVDIRYSAFAAILKIEPIDERKKILTQLVDDAEFQKSASRNLSEL